MKNMKVSLDKIRGYCTESSFERGREYFEEGLVEGVEQYESEITAYVAGTQKYKVSLRLDKKGFDAYCTCPYDWGGYCKHIVATLLALSENHDEIIEAGRKEEETIYSLLEQTTHSELKTFLKKEFEDNPILRTHFAIYFSGKDAKEKSIHDYKKEIDLLYRELSGRHGFIEYGVEVDFTSVCDLAKRYADVRNYQEAIKVYQALSEAIAENMDRVDDSNGYYGLEFDEAVNSLVDCIKKTDLTPGDKRQFIDYLFGKYVENNPDYFRENHEDALNQICDSEDDLRYWRKLLKPHLPKELPDSKGNWSEYYNAKELLLMQAHMLSQLGEKEELYNLLQRHFKQDREFCLLYAQQLKSDGKIGEAVDVAEEGVRLFAGHLSRELREFLNKFYEKHSSEKHKENLKELFCNNRDWSYYDKLKKTCSKKEWGKYLHEITDYFSNVNRYQDVLIEIYLQEEIYDKALNEVLSRENLDILGRYHSRLSGRYPKEYFNAYKKLLIPFAAGGMGRPHYRRVVQHLEKMKKIKGFKSEFNKIVEMLRKEYANRPAFLDEMKGL